MRGQQNVNKLHRQT